MSLLRPTIPNDSISNFDELRWVIQIRRTLEEELEEDGEFPVSIFNVPKPLMASDPDSYIPQQVAIGPYHYWRPELHEMERYKLSATKRFQKQLQSLKLDHLVEQLRNFEQRIRACYHRFLNFNGETLIWMMIVDASFLLEFLDVYAMQEEGREIPGVSSRMSHLLDYAGRKLAHNAILKDILMLENQIPLFVLRKMLEFKFSSLEFVDEVLLAMFIGLFKEVSPFEMMMMEEDYPEIQVSESSHLLDFLYEMIVPKLEEQLCMVGFEDQDREIKEGSEKSFVNCAKQVLSEIWRMLSKLTKASICLIKKVLLFKPMKMIICLPWIIFSNLPGVGIIKQPIEYLFFSQEQSKAKTGDFTLNNLVNKPPLMEEITIPSVTELSNSGVSFLPTNGGITTIHFDLETVTLYLPTIVLNINTEVFLRNLVAYEASMASGPLVFTRYTELMNGIIDSEEDAKVLREKGIILNHLKSDEEVAKLWNGMSKSIKLTKLPFLDKVIEDVNQYYNGRMCVKVWKLMKLYVFGSWRFLTFLVAILILLLMSLQAFCSFYKC